MDGEITRKSVLIECLQIMREELNICSAKYNGLEPKKGMEEAWSQARRKVQILQGLIQAYESEPVREALANWQQEVMEKGLPENLAEEFDGHKAENLPGDKEERAVPCRKDFMEPGPAMEPIRI